MRRLPIPQPGATRPPGSFAPQSKTRPDSPPASLSAPSPPLRLKKLPPAMRGGRLIPMCTMPRSPRQCPLPLSLTALLGILLAVAPAPQADAATSDPAHMDKGARRPAAWPHGVIPYDLSMLDAWVRKAVTATLPSALEWIWK